MNRNTKIALGVTATAAVVAGGIVGWQRYEVKRELARLERDRAAADSMRKSCYETSARPRRQEYVCPVCGERTLYPVETIMDVEAVRMLIKRSREVVPALWVKATLTLDETGLCRRCRPDAPPPAMRLVVRYASGGEESAVPVHGTDIDLLLGIAKGLPLDDAKVRASVLAKLTRLAELRVGPAIPTGETEAPQP